MAFENGNGMGPADMAALMRGSSGNGWGNDGANGWWIILFFLLCLNGGWNGWNGGWGNGGNAGGAVPYIGATADVQRGFDHQSTTAAIGALSDKVGTGFADAAVARCSGDAAITQAVTSGNAALTQAVTSGNAALTQAVTGGNAALTQAVTSGQYATAQAITGAKDAVVGGMNGLAMGLQQSNCDNKAGIADLKYTVATEACADRNAVSNGIRDVITAGTANTQNILNGLNEVIRSQQQGTQSIVDKLCALELDAVKRENADLRTRLNMADLAASQSAQTAQILQGQNAQTQAVIQSCCPKPVPAYMVPNPCGCGGYSGCGA